MKSKGSNSRGLATEVWQVYSVVARKITKEECVQFKSLQKRFPKNLFGIFGSVKLSILLLFSNDNCEGNKPTKQNQT